MLMLKTFRFDASDEQVFERAAAAGEWAIPGGFLFAGDSAETLSGKRRQAFESGFLGLDSFGWSSFAIVSEIAEERFEELVTGLARRFVRDFGAPDMAAALPVARGELEFARELCCHPVNTVLVVERSLSEEGIRERFRTLHREAVQHARIWDILEEGGPGENGP